MRFASGRIEFRVGKIPRPFQEWVHAVTVWPFIFYEREVWDDECVQVHERYHWMDQLRWLVIPWFLAYFILQAIVRSGGRKHPLEKEAYRREDLCKSDGEG